MGNCRKQPEDVCNDDTILKIYRLFQEPLPTDRQLDGKLEGELCPWYCPPRGVVDCNALLQIADDGDFIDAAVWQIHGHETAGRQRRRWLKRLQRSSRMSLIIGMRFKTAGRHHAVTIPGLWLAGLLNPPGYRRLVMGPLRPLLDGIRYKLVAWRYHKRIGSSTATLSDRTDKHWANKHWADKHQADKQSIDRAWRRAS